MDLSCNRQTAPELVRMEKLIQDHERETMKHLLEQDSRIADMLCRFNVGFPAEMQSYLRQLEKNGKLSGIVTDAVLNSVNALENKTANIINVREFGALGNGVNDDTEKIQAAIDYANAHGRAVYVPNGEYFISAPVVLNGCSMYGEPGNVYGIRGTVFECASKDFTAIRQGSTATGDIMFNISDIIVNGAETAFEIVYAINSKFERLYAVGCGTGFKIGSPDAVGCMFCEFNNLYTADCGVGVHVESREYMNNNRFNNGFLQGNQNAMKISVSGGYGAVGNVFNNVEFKSTNGRGIQMESCINTVFNSCYFECGGYAIHMKNYCSIALNNGTFGQFKQANANGDKATIRTEGGGALTIDGGVVFLTDEYIDHKFMSANIADVYQNVVVHKNIVKNGTADGFRFFDRATANHEQIVTTGTVTIPADGNATVDFTYEIPFYNVPRVMCVTMRGAEGAERGLSFLLSSRLPEGGTISISNTSTGQRSVSFSIYARSE